MIETIDSLDAAYKQLGGKGATPHSEALLVENYGNASRYYHTHTHREFMAAPISNELKAYLGDVSDNTINIINALQKIIGDAHDSHYIQVDGGLSELAEDSIQPYIDINQKAYSIKLSFPDNKAAKITLDLFNMQPGYDLSASPEQNEFLSALIVALDMEQARVPLRYIACVVQGIAGTVPFKPQNYMNVLDRRLHRANDKYTLKLDEETLRISQLVAVDMANRDVASFRSDDLGEFVTGTMQLIPENLAEVRHGATPRAFLNSLKWSISFFKTLNDPYNNKLDIRNVFHQTDWGGYPDDKTYAADITKATKNTEACSIYLKCKQVSAALVAAMATLINESETLLLDFVRGSDFDNILQGKRAVLSPFEQTILNVLESRKHGSIGSYDIDSSPIARALFEALGTKHMMALFDSADVTDLDDPESARLFLQTLASALGEENVYAFAQTLANIARDPDKGCLGEVNEARANALEKLSF